MSNWDINEILLALNLKKKFNRNLKIKKGDLFIAI